MPDSAEAMTLLETEEGHAARHGENAQGSAEVLGKAEGTGAPHSLGELHYPIYMPLTAEQRAQLQHDLQQQRESEISFAGFFLGRKHAEIALTRRIDDLAGAPAWNLSLASIMDKVRTLTARSRHRALGDLLRQLNPALAGSPGVPSLSHDVAPEAPRRAFATHLQG